MKIQYLYIVLAMLIAAVFSSCEEKDIELYGKDSYVVFEMPVYGLGNTPRDSIVRSFPAKGDECTEDIIHFKMRIIGTAVDYDRTVSLKVNEEKSTAQEGVNYKLDPIVVKAGEYTADVPLVIYRAGLKDKSVRLQLEVEPNEYFGQGFSNRVTGIFVWGDMYIKPDNWDTSNYKPCFGEFTETRYAFILKHCNILELPDPQDLTTMGYYNAKVREALFEYNKNNEEPLTDELGVVVFPTWTGTGGVG